MQAETSGSQTQPEERAGREGGAGTPTLLLVSLARRDAVALPADGEITIGRGRSGATRDRFHAVDDEMLSRSHLRITRQEQGHVVEDLASLNGTFVDGRRLTAPARLREGSVLFFGGQIAIYRCVSDAAGRALQQEVAAPFGSVPTSSPSLALLFARLRRLARTDAEILLVGERGIDKEDCARAIHRASGRPGQFVTVDCASLPEAQLESELFGQPAGASPTPVSAETGLIGSADGGTLLLDDVGAIPAAAQARIFRLVRDGGVRRRVDVRLIAGTTQVDAVPGPGATGDHLLARLAADPNLLPPLRERPEDIPALVAHSVAQRVPGVEPAALRALCLYSWPLNVHELQKVIRNALAIAEDGELRLEHLSAPVRAALERGPLVAVPRRSPRVAPERAELEQLLRDNDGNVAEVARTLDRKWNVVWRWLVRLGLDPEKFRGKSRPPRE
ncbi:MAG TPA: sigma 54-interacting transcriptional regulator [Polyangia bacterium]|nr:sigma 54-interacting transcriptional regulator [Polyangia bacterium]